MKLVLAIIKPFKLDEVRQALTEIGVHGMTVTEVKGYGAEGPHRNLSRREYVVNYVPKLRIKVANDSGMAHKVIEEITYARAPARSATARSLSPTSKVRCVFAQEKRTATRCKAPPLEF